MVHVPIDILETVEHKYILELSLVCTDETEPAERIKRIRWMHSLLSKSNYKRLTSESITKEAIIFLLNNLEEYSDIGDLFTPISDYINSYNPPLVDLRNLESATSAVRSITGNLVEFTGDENISWNNNPHLTTNSRPTTPQRTINLGTTVPPPIPDPDFTTPQGRINPGSTTPRHAVSPEPTTPQRANIPTLISAPAIPQRTYVPGPTSIIGLPPRTNIFNIRFRRRYANLDTLPPIQQVGQVAATVPVQREDDSILLGVSPQWIRGVSWEQEFPSHPNEGQERTDTQPHQDTTVPDWIIGPPFQIGRRISLQRREQSVRYGQEVLRLPPQVMLKDDYPCHLFPATFVPHPPIRPEHLIDWEQVGGRERRRDSGSELAEFWRPLRRSRLEDFVELPTYEQVERMLDLRDIFIKIRRSIGHPCGSDFPRFIRIVNGVFPPLGPARYSRPRPRLEESRNVGGWKLSARIEPVAAFLYAEKNDCIAICLNELVRRNKSEKVETEFRFLPKTEIPALEKFFAECGCGSVPTPSEFTSPYVFYLDDEMKPIIKYVKNEVRMLFETLFEEGSTDGLKCLHCEKKGTLSCGNVGCSMLYCKKCFHCWFSNRDECKSCEKPHIAFSKRSA
jgi:hypothetical protein